MVVVAGSNGCGKTQIYNAIRLLKSTYGGYQPNEYQQWWSEFQINLNKPTKHIYGIFRDKNKPIEIGASFNLTASERAFLRNRAESAIRTKIWQEVAPGLQQSNITGSAAFANAQRVHGEAVDRRTEDDLVLVNSFLNKATLDGHLIVNTDLRYRINENIVLELLFSIYEPNDLGIIDYHGAHRTYNRERLGGINLNLNQSEERGKQHSLYNWINKFTNIKSELAAGYVRDLISKEAGKTGHKLSSLTSTLQELFKTFFPGKKFIGPAPGTDGTLDFPVQSDDNTEHDIDDLSSGEKEVLFGYLRLRNNAPQNSVLLIDEPELHLNPALLQGLPQFYHKHIGKELGNQLWLVTHSDALLRESVGQPDFSVFHMQQARITKIGENQLKRIDVGKPLERALIDLIGDLATYQPDKKVVIFEGGGNVDFDVRMTTALFPKFNVEVTTISAGDREKVQNLHALLKKASESRKIDSKYFSIVDRDSGPIERSADSYSWDRYHIENYLLESSYILEVLKDLNTKSEKLKTPNDVDKELVVCAQETLNDLVRHELESKANSEMVAAIKTQVARNPGSVASELSKAIISTKNRIEDAISGSLSLASLERDEKFIRNKYSQHLKDGTWLKTFRGRDVLKRFVDQHVNSVKYEVFRDLIIARMRDKGFQPIGMHEVIEKILRA